MRIAVIDLGTNSVRFDVHQLGPGDRVLQLHREKLMVRLGQNVFLKGRLDRSASQRTIHAFLRFKKVAERLRAEKTIAFGTSALREAKDRERFLGTLYRKTKIHVRVISGQEEAKLIAEGVLANEKVDTKPFALVDIGGGSTELTVVSRRQIRHSHSFPLGTARLQQVFLKRSPPQAAAIQNLREYIRNTLQQKLIAENWGKVDTILGSSGTIKAVGKILKRETGKATIERKDLRRLVDLMATMNTGQLLCVTGMEAKRVDMILSGAILLDEIMHVLGVKKCRVSDYSMRDGVLREEMQLYRQHRSSHLSLHLPELFEKARRLGRDPNHIRRVASMAATLFNRLSPLHKLKPDWQTYLVAAAVLRDTGEAVSLMRHEVHSYYMVKNTDLPGLESWEAEFLALLCLEHENEKSEVPELGLGFDKVKNEAFRKLLAMLRILDALDSGADFRVEIKRVRLTPKRVILSLSKRTSTGLEALNLERKKKLFERLFRRTPCVELV